MISRVTIENFKSIGEPGVDLELNPLTLLVGPNGSGKSSILEAIAVAIQDAPGGTLTNFQSWEAIVHKPNGTKATTELFFSSGDFGDRLGIRFSSEATGQHQFDFLVNGIPDKSAAARQTILKLKPDQTSNAFMLGSARGDVPYAANTRANPRRSGTKGENLLPILAIIFGQRQHRDKAIAIAR